MKHYLALDLMYHDHDDALATVYTFSSVRPGYVVDVAVPHDDVLRIATEVALRAALAGIRLPGRSLVNRRRSALPAPQDSA